MYEMNRTVYHCATAEDGCLKLHEALAMMMDCCQFQEYAETRFRQWLEEQETAVFLSFIQMDILRRPAFRENLKLKVVIYDCQSIYGFRRITMRDEQDSLCMIANAVGCFFNFRTGRACKLPGNVHEMLTIDPAEDMECLPRKILLPKEPGIPLPPYTVVASALDQNRHLTSSMYLAAAQDRLPEEYSFDRVRIEFKHQSAKGETLRLAMNETAPGVRLIRLGGQDGQLHAAVEFSKRGV